MSVAKSTILSKKMNKPPKIALLTLDSAISNQAINGFIKKHHDRLGLVIVSNPMGSRRGGSIGQFIQLYRHSGLKFALYLTYCFFVFPLILAGDFLISELLGRTGEKLSIKQQCKLYNIPYKSSDNINSRQISRLLEELGIDLIISCFFDQILHDEIIKLPGLVCLNMHPGILPGCRGVFPEFHTAAGKYPAFGITIHRIDDASIDTGRILLAKTVDVNGMKSMLAIGRKLLTEGLTAMDEILPDIESRLANAKSQGEGNYYSYPSREDIRKLEDAGFTLW